MVKIIVDSGSDLTLEQAGQLGVEIVPLHIEHEGKTALDRVEMDPDTLYEKLANSDQLPKTSQPSPAAFMTMYEKFPNDELLVLPIAKELSGTFQSANLAKSMSERDNIFVVDSQQVTLPLMVLILEAVAMREKGWNARQIKEALEAMRGQVKVIAVVDTLDYLQKGGRLSKAAAIAGNFLKIKPLIGVQEGQVVVLSKARGTKSAIQEVRRLMAQDEVDLNTAIFGYTGQEGTEDLTSWTEEILDVYPFANVYTQQIGAAIGTHVGPGAKAIAYRTK